MYGPILRLIIEGYLDLTISALVQLQSLIIYGGSDGLGIVFTFIMLSITITAPLIVVFFLKKNAQNLETRDFAIKCNSLYSEFNINRGTSLYFIGFFLLRRLLFSLTCLYLIDSPWA